MGEYVPYNICFVVFMSAQGCGIENSVLYQDNQSAMRMEKMDVIHVRETPHIYISDLSS